MDKTLRQKIDEAYAQAEHAKELIEAIWPDENVAEYAFRISIAELLDGVLVHYPFELTTEEEEAVFVEAMRMARHRAEDAQAVLIQHPSIGESEAWFDPQGPDYVLRFHVVIQGDVEPDSLVPFIEEAAYDVLAPFLALPDDSLDREKPSM